MLRPTRYREMVPTRCLADVSDACVGRTTLSREAGARRQLSLPQSIQFIDTISQRSHIPFRRRTIITGGLEAIAQLIVRQLRELRTDP